MLPCRKSPNKSNPIMAKVFIYGAQDALPEKKPIRSRFSFKNFLQSNFVLGCWSSCNRHSSQALLKAEAGLYADENVSRLPQAFKIKYFEQLKGGQWQIKNQVKSRVLIDV